MGRSTAEDKYRAKQDRRRGLQKTRFYCQVCERQCLDENGFKCHVQSEIHVKNLQAQLDTHGGSTRGVVREYSDKFVKDFTSLLRKSHGVKMIGANRFYQEYIRNKDHIHLNSTRWKLLTNALLYMKQEGILKVVDSNGVNDEQFYIGYIDNSPEAIKRRKREEMESSGDFLKDDELIGGALDQSIKDQIEKAEQMKAKLEELKQEKKAKKSAHQQPQSGLAPKKKISFALKGKLKKQK